MSWLELIKLVGTEKEKGCSNLLNVISTATWLELINLVGTKKDEDGSKGRNLQKLIFSSCKGYPR